MATSLRKELAYDASPDAVAAMLADAAFREEVLARQHVLRGSATVEGDTVVVEQVQSAASLPSFARKFVGDEIVIVQTERWGSTTAADLHLTIPGKPGDITGASRSPRRAPAPSRSSTSPSRSPSRSSAARSRSSSRT